MRSVHTVMRSVQIRPATLSDHAAIVAFNLQLAVETEDKTLDRERLSRGVAALLAGGILVASVLVLSSAIPQPNLTLSRVHGSLDRTSPEISRRTPADPGSSMCCVAPRRTRLAAGRG